MIEFSVWGDLVPKASIVPASIKGSVIRKLSSARVRGAVLV